MKKLTTSKLKKKLDTVFSKYIRLKYSLNGNVVCYTCGAVKDITSIQNGHFISRVYLATRFDEDNCRPQCVGCNVFGKGKPVEFARKLELEKKGIVEKLYKKAQAITKDYPYEEKIRHYEEKIKQMQRN